VARYDTFALIVLDVVCRLVYAFQIVVNNCKEFSISSSYLELFLTFQPLLADGVDMAGSVKFSNYVPMANNEKSANNIRIIIITLIRQINIQCSVGLDLCWRRLFWLQAYLSAFKVWGHKTIRFFENSRR